MEESVDQAYLHELWLRELECRAIIGGQEVLLNTDYDPPLPEKLQRVRVDEDAFRVPIALS